MSRPRLARRLRRGTLGPLAVTALLAALTGAAVTVPVLGPGPGVLLTWLLLGLTAGYALSGSV